MRSPETSLAQFHRSHLCSAATNRQLSAFLSESDLELFRTQPKARATIEDGTLDLVIASGSTRSQTWRVIRSAGALLMLLPENIGSRAGRASGGASLRRRSFCSCTNSIRSIQVRQLLTANHLQPELVLRVPSSSPSPGWWRRDWGYRDTANDAEYGVREGCGGAVCQAGTDPRADVAAESLASR